jgi:hypothetical protein
MPLSFDHHISHFTKRGRVSMSNNHIRCALRQTLHNRDHLRARFAGAEDNFRKALAR